MKKLLKDKESVVKAAKGKVVIAKTAAEAVANVNEGGYPTNKH
ncbi:hypothetical protein ACO1ED_04700 [Bacillus cereus]